MQWVETVRTRAGHVIMYVQNRGHGCPRRARAQWVRGKCKQREQTCGREARTRRAYHTQGLARAKISPHFAFFSTAGTRWCAYDDDDAVAAEGTGPGMCAAVVGDAWSIWIGVPIVPLPTTRTEWSSYPSGVDGGALDAGDVEVDMDDSGVSGVSGVLGEDEAEYGGAPAWTGTGGGIGFGGDVDGGCCERAAKDGAGAVLPVCALYGVVDGMGEGAGEGRTYVG